VDWGTALASSWVQYFRSGVVCSQGVWSNVAKHASTSFIGLPTFATS
jgi:hypothetical protein